jgi:hypothetical protein
MTNNNKQGKKTVQATTPQEHIRKEKNIIHTPLERVMIKSTVHQIKKETTKSGNEIISSK